MLDMGVIFDYFAAGSDEEAASVIDRVGGPSSQSVLVPAQPSDARRGLFGRKRPKPEPSFAMDPGLAVYDTVSVKGIDPVVQLGTLEELLTGRAYDEVVEDPRSGHALATRDAGERLVCTLTGTVATALAGAGSEELQRVAEPWSQTEEFWGDADPEELAEVLGNLAGLAQRAQANGHHLYCWVCV
jgi:hypothetical protein